MLDASEIDSKIRKLEELRIGYRRRKQKELKILNGISYEDPYGENVENTLMLVKEYIRGANNFKKELAEKKSLVDLKTQESIRRLELFLESEVRSTIRSLHGVFTTDVRKLNEVADQRCNLFKQIQRFTNITRLIHELLGSTNAVTEMEVDNILSSYHDLRKLIDSHASLVDEEPKLREITNLEIFNKSKLKISLLEFNGYESKFDIYTFPSEFLKIYQRPIAKIMRADVFKNNLLTGPALSLVKSITDFDELWERLKLIHLGKTNQIWKLTDSGKIVKALSKMIMAMKDLEHLACGYNIVARL